MSTATISHTHTLPPDLKSLAVRDLQGEPVNSAVDAALDRHNVPRDAYRQIRSRLSARLSLVSHREYVEQHSARRRAATAEPKSRVEAARLAVEEAKQKVVEAEAAWIAARHDCDRIASSFGIIEFSESKHRLEMLQTYSDPAIAAGIRRLEDKKQNLLNEMSSIRSALTVHVEQGVDRESGQPLPPVVKDRGYWEGRGAAGRRELDKCDAAAAREREVHCELSALDDEISKLERRQLDWREVDATYQD